MTTKKEKKGAKKVKPVKRGGPDAERQKVVAKAPKVNEVDKEKMAAFFSAAGLKESATVEKPEAVAPPVEAEIVAPAEAETPAAAAASPVPEIDNLKEEDKGKIEMTTTETTDSSTHKSDSCSFSVLPMFVVLFCLAAFWFYYISAAPQPQATAVQMEQSQTKIQLLEAQVEILQAEVQFLQAELAALSAPAPEAKAKKPAVAAKTPPRSASFDKAPVPFWRTKLHPHAGQVNKLSQKQAASAPAVKSEKVDSFSKAPVPFWRKIAAGNNEVQAERETVRKNHGSSFDKAPIPFWRK